MNYQEILAKFNDHIQAEEEFLRGIKAERAEVQERINVTMSKMSHLKASRDALVGYLKFVHPSDEP